MPPARPLCACGLSATPPYCDGAHVAAGWTCAARDRTATWFLAAGRYQNLARRLASARGGAAAEGPEPVAGRVVMVSDAPGLPEVLARLAPGAAATLLLLAPDDAAAVALAPQVPRARLDPADPLGAFSAAQRALDALGMAAGPAASPAPAAAGAPRLRRAFLSHAVADEARLLPAVDRLRAAFGAEVFVCADSIAPGDRWASAIARGLEAAEVVVAAVSSASGASHYCSYELGVAAGLGRDLRLVSLDGARPPPFAADIQCVDLPRLAAARPWLDPDELLVEALLGALAPPG